MKLTHKIIWLYESIRTRIWRNAQIRKLIREQKKAE
jgi:hypothetical protein